MTVNEEEFVSPNLFWQPNLYRCLKKLLPAIFLLALLVPAASHGEGDDVQPYVELKNEKYKKLSNQLTGSTIPRILRESDYPKSGASKKTLEVFFWKWFFPEMMKPDELEKIRSWREELKKFFKKARAKSPKDALNQLTLEMMEGIVRGPKIVLVKDEKEEVIQVGERFFLLDGSEIIADTIQGAPKPSENDFHPAVKYNAMLIIAGLNNWTERRGDSEPWPPTYQPLLEYAKPPWSDSLRVAALNGLKRYCHLKDHDPRLVINAMKEILTEEADTDADIWIQRQAVNNLGELAKSGKIDGTVVSVLVGLVANEQKPTALRVAAASALGRTILKQPPEGGATAYARQLGNLALELSLDETEGKGAGNGGFLKLRLMADLAAPLAGLGSFLATTDQQDASGSVDYAKRIVEAIREIRSAASAMSLNSTQSGAAAQLGPGIRKLEQILSEEPSPADSAESAEGDTESADGENDGN